MALPTLAAAGVDFAPMRAIAEWTAATQRLSMDSTPYCEISSCRIRMQLQCWWRKRGRTIAPDFLELVEGIGEDLTMSVQFSAAMQAKSVG